MKPLQRTENWSLLTPGPGEPVDQPLLDQVLHLIDGGRYELPVDQTVRVVRQNGIWQVCELAPTP